MADFIDLVLDPEISFMRYALASGVLSSIAMGIIGTYVVARRLTYLAGAIAHSTLGGIGAVVIWRLDYRLLEQTSWVILALVGGALAYLAFAFVLYKLPSVPVELVRKLPFIGGPIKGSFRWLRLGGFSLQPSEFAKPALILCLSEYFGRRARHIHEFRRGFIIPLLPAGLVLGLIFLGKDLSTTVITGAVVFLLAFIAGVRLRYLMLTALAGILFFAIVLHTSPERMRRFTTYDCPEEHQQAEGYQLWSSQLALGSGGARGLGFTNSRMKQLYLPEAHTDFIVAIIGEELGFVAVCSLILGYCLLVVAAFWIAALAPDRQGALIGAGVGLSIGFHAFVNISVVSGFCPTTGVTAPLLSYGGSSMLASLLGIGMLLSVSRVSEDEAGKPAGEGRQLSALPFGPVR